MLPSRPPSKNLNQALGFLIVSLSMIEMFTIPRSYFVLGSIVSTSIMASVAYLLAQWGKKTIRIGVKHFFFAVVVAILHYLLFLLGNLGVRSIHIPGMTESSEQNIYGLFNNIPLPVLVVVLILDAVGFELYFRGNILERLSPRINILSGFAVASIDAAIHIATLNPLFPATTFVADSVWGLYYYRTRDITSTILCHFIWDLMIFVIYPIH